MIGDRLRRRRQALGFSLQDLADRLEGIGVKLSRAALSNYETNKAMPSAKTLWALASILEASMEYFLFETSTRVVLQGFRKKARTPQSTVDRLTAFVTEEIEKRAELDALLGDSGPEEVPTPSLINAPEEAESIAHSVRKQWGLGNQPIASVASLLESQGWYIVEVPNDPDFDGLAGYVEDTRRPFAVSRKGISVDRTRLNLLHEAGHAYVAGLDEKASEKATFRFATALLFPKERVYDELGRKRSSIDMEELLMAKKKYGLSMQAIAFRLRDLGVISESLFTMFFRYFNQMDFRKEEPGSKELGFQEEPVAFASKLHRAFAEGLISENDAARLMPGFRATLEAPGRLSMSEIKKILSLPAEERERILAASADAAQEMYSDAEVNISGLADDIIEYP